MDTNTWSWGYKLQEEREEVAHLFSVVTSDKWDDALCDPIFGWLDGQGEHG